MLGKCSEDADKLIWKASKSGNLLFKSFYSSLESGGVSFSSKVVWGFWVSLKVSFFFCLGGCMGKLTNPRST